MSTTNTSALPILTGPKPAKGKGKTPMADIRTMVAEADSYIEKSRLVESLESELEMLKQQLRPEAESERLALELQTGQCIKSVLVHGTKDTLRISFSDRFKKISVEHEAALKEHLGTAFDAIIRRTDEIKVKDGTTESKLREVLGERFDQFFTSTPQLQVSSTGMEARARLRPVVSESVNAAIDSVLCQAQYSPSFVAK